MMTQGGSTSSGSACLRRSRPLIGELAERLDLDLEADDCLALRLLSDALL
jgi:hypothetical protein